jgi:arylsulfatase A-like enzyme
MYEEAVRVPMLLRVPGLSEGQRRISAPVSQVDLVPTLLDLLGMPVPSHLEGQSWRPALHEGAALPESDVIVEWNGPDSGLLGARRRELPPHLARMTTYEDAWRSVTAQVRTIITPTGWKFNCSPIGEHELYNVADDPGETENLFEHESVEELVADLYTRLLDWQEQTRDEARLASDPRLD